MADYLTPEQRSMNALRAVMSTREGRRYLWELMGRCGIMQSAFSPDALVLSFNEGQRNIGLSVFSDIEAHCPESYLIMVKEAKEDNDYDRHHAEQHRDDGHDGDDGGYNFNS